MTRTVGHVTELGSNTRSKQFAASFRGSTLGSSFRSAAEARAAVQRSFGGPPLRWESDDFRNGVQSFLAFDPAFCPSDLDGLLLWNETSVMRPDPTNGRVRIWGDQASRGRVAHPSIQTNPNNQPIAIDGVSTPNGFPALSFATDTGEKLFVNDRIQSSEVDMGSLTLMAVASPVAPGAQQRQAVVIRTDGLQSDLGLNNGGMWEVSNGIDRLVGPAAPAGSPSTVTWVQDSTGGRLFVDGTLGDSNATVPNQTFGSITIGALSSGTQLVWGGLIWAVLLWRRPLADYELTLAWSYLERLTP